MKNSDKQFTEDTEIPNKHIKQGKNMYGNFPINSDM